MIRFSILSIMLASSALFANPTINSVRDDFETAEAYHVGAGKVFHDGDFVEFNLSFSASCYADRNEAWNNLTVNVQSFVDWINQERAAGSYGVITYSASPINVWDNNYSSDSNCYNTFQASQAIKITLNRSEENAALSVDAIQNFYNDLQVVIAPYSVRSDNISAYSIASVQSVQKGLYEETADELRIAAKNRAREKATKDFLSTIGGDFNGDWYLIGADYRESVNAHAYLPSVAAAPYAPYPINNAVLDLGPIEVLVSGTFHFVYDLN